MSLSCLFGRHRPSQISIARKAHKYVALCDGCARPLERMETGSWAACEPLDGPREQRV
jgi:hypothetical protein